MELLPNTYEGLVWGLQNFDGIETDLRLTSDNKLVLHHDPKTSDGKIIRDMTYQEAKDLGIPSFEDFLTIPEVIELSADRKLYLELKPDCDGKNRISFEIVDIFYRSFEEVISKSSINKQSIYMVSFVKELLDPFTEKYPCMVIVPEVNECNFSVIRALPSLLTRSLHYHLRVAKKRHYRGVFFARSYLNKAFALRQPSYRRLLKLAKEYDLELGTNVTYPRLEKKCAKIERFSDTTNIYPRRAEAGFGSIIAHRGTGVDGVVIPDDEVPKITFTTSSTESKQDKVERSTNSTTEEEKTTRSEIAQNMATKANNSTYNLEITAITDEADTIKTFRFNKPAEFSFQPGQYCWLSIPGFSRSPMAIASAKQSEFLEFSVRIWGQFTQKLFTKVPGDSVVIDGPHGTHFPEERITDSTPFYLIAGGTGITPVRSLVNSLKDRGNKVVVYGAKTPQELLYQVEMGTWPAEIELAVEIPDDNFKGTVGLVTDAIKQMDYDPSGIAFVCGPRMMEKAVVEVLKEKGFSEDNILLSVEKFDNNGDVVGPIIPLTHPEVPF